MAQIRQVVSEALQAQIRSLLPSQQGFTEDLQATNVITPIIDLTPTAEGSTLSTDLARSIAFGSQTSFDIANTTTTLANTAGFWRIFGAGTTITTGGGDRGGSFTMSDGLSTKTVWEFVFNATNVEVQGPIAFDFIVFLASGESISGVSDASTRLSGSYRQVADVNGVTVNPSGFSSS